MFNLHSGEFVNVATVVISLGSDERNSAILVEFKLSTRDDLPHAWDRKL
jgi:hypothetical protein